MHPRLAIYLLAAAAIVLIAGCIDREPPHPTTSYEASAPVCETGPSLPSMQIDSRLRSIGEAANVIKGVGEHIYVLESLRNTLSRYHPQTDTFEEAWIDLGNGRGPYDMAFGGADQTVWVTNYVANTVTVASLRDGAILDEIASDKFQSPSGVALSERFVYVTNVQWGQRAGSLNPFGPGSVTVLDRATRQVLGSIDAPAPNPQFVEVVDTSDGPRVVVTSTGALAPRPEDGIYAPSTEGAVAVWQETDRPLAPQGYTLTVPMPEYPSTQGALGRAMITPEGDRLYFTSATASVLYTIDLTTTDWARGPDDPIRLYTSMDNAMHHGMIDRRGLVWITSFNRDAIYVLDSRCDALIAGPIPIGSDPDQIDGPHGVAILDAHPNRAFFIQERANQLGSLTLSLP